MNDKLLKLFNEGKKFAEYVGVQFYKRHYKAHRDNALSIEDFKQEALAGLWYSIKMSEFKYDKPSNDYLHNGILMYLYKLMRNNKNSIAIANSQCYDIFEKEENDFMLDEKWIKVVNDEVVIKQLIDKYIAENPGKGERNVDMLCKFYGLLNSDVYSMKGIASLHGVHENTVANVIASMLSKFQQYEESDRVDGSPSKGG